MPKIESSNPTLEAIDAILELQHQNEPKRNYIGASSIGDSCSRKLWYRLNSEHKEVFKADSIKRFNDGHRSEEEMAKLLRLVPGIELYTHDDKGDQYGFKDGPYSGHYDGVIKGILEAPDKFHVWEHKCVNEKLFKELQKLKNVDEKTALEKWSNTYYAQAVTYMFYEEIDRHYMTVSTPGLRDYMSVRTESNDKFAKALRDKALRIAGAKEPPERIGNETHWECRMCSFHGVCHGS